MKKFNKNSLLFIFVVVFIITGLLGKCAYMFKYQTEKLISGLLNGNAYSVFEFKYYLDGISDTLSYHDTMMDINSIKENLLGTRVVKKDDAIIVKSADGSLINLFTKFSESKILKSTTKIEELKKLAEGNGSDFLFCVTPRKELYEILPKNIENTYVSNYNYFVSTLQSKGIPYLDFSVALKENGVKDSDIFYYTDHHWRATSGFIATKSICDELNERYGFEYDRSLTDINNYNVEIFPDWFLGSSGKKVGTFFSWRGADDFELITPKFETNLTETQPFKDQIRNGSFEETVLYKENLEKSPYLVNTYATYSGGDFRLQIIKNNLNPEGKKVLLIRDSFACVVAPFLSLQTSELHVCDIRDGDYYVGDKIDLESYIQEINPDYVIVICSSFYSH